MFSALFPCLYLTQMKPELKLKSYSDQFLIYCKGLPSGPLIMIRMFLAKTPKPVFSVHSFCKTARVQNLPHPVIHLFTLSPSS